MPASELAYFMDKAIPAAFAAGKAIMQVRRTALDVSPKQDGSPVTQADREAHQTIQEHLTDTGLPVLSEEGATIEAEERQRWELYWLVDPLDGTKEFIKGNGEYSVNIALMRRDQLPAGPAGAAMPVAGVLYVPVKDLLYFAWEGGGAYRQHDAATQTPGPTYDRAALALRLPAMEKRGTYTIVASRSHTNASTSAFIERKRFEHGAVRIARMGSALKICLVAEGAADVYPRFGPTMEWDTAAGHAICNETGRTITDMATGRPMRYNKYDLMNNAFIVE